VGPGRQEEYDRRRDAVAGWGRTGAGESRRQMRRRHLDCVADGGSARGTLNFEKGTSTGLSSAPVHEEFPSPSGLRDLSGLPRSFHFYPISSTSGMIKYNYIYIYIYIYINIYVYTYKCDCGF
jgi:hypothetical protein